MVMVKLAELLPIILDQTNYAGWTSASLDTGGTTAYIDYT
jgi:hypothetical protein